MESKFDFEKKCNAVFDGIKFNDPIDPILVHTGRGIDGMPAFKAVIPMLPTMVRIGKSEIWGITCYDPKTEKNEFYPHNDCVSLNDFAVLGFLLDQRYPLLCNFIPNAYASVRKMAYAQLAEGVQP